MVVLVLVVIGYPEARADCCGLEDTLTEYDKGRARTTAVRASLSVDASASAGPPSPSSRDCGGQLGVPVLAKSFVIWIMSAGIVRISGSLFNEMPERALTLIIGAGVQGTETEQAVETAEGAAMEQFVESVEAPDLGREPIDAGTVARSGDSARLRQRGFRVTERATSCGCRSS